jgi:hypothetical protein
MSGIARERKFLTLSVTGNKSGVIVGEGRKVEVGKDVAVMVGVDVKVGKGVTDAMGVNVLDGKDASVDSLFIGLAANEVMVGLRYSGVEHATKKATENRISKLRCFFMKRPLKNLLYQEPL